MQLIQIAVVCSREKKQESSTSFSFLKDLHIETGVTLLQIPVFRIHIKVGTLAPSAMIDSHKNAIIRILFSH